MLNQQFINNLHTVQKIAFLKAESPIHKSYTHPELIHIKKSAQDICTP